MIWLALVVPILGAIFARVLWMKRVLWAEMLIPVAVGVVVIFFGKMIGERSATTAVEYLGSYVQTASYYEPWNEKVPCRHPIYCVRCSGYGKRHSCTTYVCGHEHLYDVDYHPAHWNAYSADAREYPIEQSTWERLTRQFGNRKFRDMHRRYYSINGNAYDTVWPSDKEAALEPTTRTEQYENRVQASNSVFRFTPVAEEDVKAFGLLGYPGVANYSSSALLGWQDPSGEHELQVINALLGARKQVRVFVLVFKNQPLQIGVMQQRYWKGGQKNEFDMAVGVDGSGRVQWAYPFSWTERQELKFAARDILMAQDKLDVAVYARWLRPQLLRSWKRKEFHDFDYLSIEVSTTCVVVTWVLVVLSTVGVLFWVVQNEFRSDGDDRWRRTNSSGPQ